MRNLFCNLQKNKIPERSEKSPVDYRINYEKLCFLIRQITKEMNLPIVSLFTTRAKMHAAKSIITIWTMILKIQLLNVLNLSKNFLRGMIFLKNVSIMMNWRDFSWSPSTTQISFKRCFSEFGQKFVGQPNGVESS